MVNILDNEDRFDSSVDDATHAVMACFDWMGLPEGDDLSDLMIRVNDALAVIMQAYKPE